MSATADAPGAGIGDAALAALPDGPRRHFASAVLRREAPVAGPDGPDGLARALLDAFSFAEGRWPEPLALRVRPAGATALDGGTPRGTLIQVACEDRPFVVTSLTEELHRLGLRPARFLAASYGSTRDTGGHLVGVGPARGASQAEGFSEIELDERLAEDRVQPVLDSLGLVLDDVFAATADGGAMRVLLSDAAETTRANAKLVHRADEVDETVALLDWLLDGNSVLLGACRFEVGTDGRILPAEPSTRLGLARGGAESGPADGPAVVLGVPPASLPARLVDVARLPLVSTVHRRVPVQRIDVPLIDGQGHVTAVARLACVFSRRAEASPAHSVPLLRWKLDRVLELEDAVRGSYDEQAVTSLFQALPKDDLFCNDVGEIKETIDALLAEDRDHRVRVLTRAEPDAGSVSVLVTMPSELYTGALRTRVSQFLLAQLDGERIEVELSMGDSADTVARFLVHLSTDAPVPGGLEAVAHQVRLLCRTWEQQLAGELAPRLGERAHRVASWAADRLPASYRDAIEPAAAVADVLVLDAIDGEAGADGLRVWFTTPVGTGSSGPDEHLLTVVGAGPVVELSRLVPLVESLGLWVVDELHWQVGGLGLHHLTVRPAAEGVAFDAETDGPRASEALVALWEGRAAADRLNRLVTAARMSWTQVAVLRAYRRYRRQVDHRYAGDYLDEALVANAGVARLLLDLFEARFGPDGPDPERCARIESEVAAACDDVVLLDHDRILRGLAGTISATVRTNVGTRPEGPLALSIDPAAVPGMPDPRPYREVFVHGPRVEGIHLRAGPVARGGIRMSDRPEDYRAEVLDLMTTQVLKNALIVPTGAKGGFVVRRRTGGSADPADADRMAYESFVSCLLDLADDIHDGRVVPVPGRWDGDDPYLVVAADKGTASYSDVANRVALARGFWLGDAFASGGSVGYDHRALGITARGAWVAIARHFRELGVDVALEPFTVAGVGDMSGDVFGSGMLRSRATRLVAAFDHRDIFLDPSPDGDASFEERRRLHDLPGSSWQHYDRALISTGGGVFPRSAKRVELTREVRDLLRVDDEAMTPAELVRAVLAAPVDLLYLGGVGTYIRSSVERDDDIDDRANAEVRVEAASLRARVVGEGANLGLTQRARVEYARRGGHVNMDAIDNAAGVDISDREVNVKILLDLAVAAGEVDAGERARLLAEATDDVVASVLGDCADQADSLARARAASASELDALESAQRTLARAGLVDPVAGCLPTPDEYAARRRAGAGLTAPELAVLLAGAKRQVKAAVLASDLPDQRGLHDVLVGYFPPGVVARVGHLVDQHRLRRELVASELANDLVDHLGPSAVTRLGQEVGGSPIDTVAAYWVAREVLGAPGLWATLVAAGPGAPADVTADRVDPGCLLASVLEALTRAELTTRLDLAEAGTPHDLAARVAQDRPVCDELRTVIPALDLPDRDRARRRLADGLAAGGAPAGLVTELAVLAELDITGDVAALARSSGRPVATVAATYLTLSDALGVDRLLARVEAVEVTGGWDRAARHGLADDLLGARRAATREALARSPEAGDDAGPARAWLAERAAGVDAARATLRHIEAEGATGLEALGVAVRAVRRFRG